MRDLKQRAREILIALCASGNVLEDNGGRLVNVIASLCLFIDAYLCYPPTIPWRLENNILFL